MKKVLFILLLLIVGCYFLDDDAKANVYLKKGNQYIGQVVFKDTPQGLLVEVDFKNLPAGEHGFHIHENPSCEDGLDKNGVLQAALKAGDHYDPNKTEKHLGPNGQGHKGDLPFLKTDLKGKTKTSFYVPNLTVKEIRERSVVVHENGDNYKDEPVALGGGGKRIACGIIR